jgi:hypothetical protein
MSARDLLHDEVRHSLEKDGWTITHDPLSIPFAGSRLEIDLGAEQLIAAEKGEQRIAVEVKSFMGASLVSEFHTALGQYLIYDEALRRNEPERVLYLAIPEVTYRTFFAEDIVGTLIQRHEVKLLVFDPDAEVIALWTN